MTWRNFRPEEPWPMWAIVAVLMAVAFFVAARKPRLTKRQIVDDHRCLMAEKERLARVAEQAALEKWSQTAQESLARQQEEIERRLTEYN